MATATTKAPTTRTVLRALRAAEFEDRDAGEDVGYHMGSRMSATLDRFPGWRLGLRPAEGGGALLGCWRAQNERTGRSYDL